MYPYFELYVFVKIISSLDVFLWYEFMRNFLKLMFKSKHMIIFVTKKLTGHGNLNIIYNYDR